MGFDFGGFGDGRLSEGFVEWLVDERWVDIGRHFGRLWDYYHNATHEVSRSGTEERDFSETSRGYVQAQEIGLPPRITGVVYGGGGVSGGQVLEQIARKEVVIENDIGWRINAMVDFLFGKGVRFESKAPEAARRRELEQIIKAVYSANGGVRFFQDMAVLGSVYGFVDCVVRPLEEAVFPRGTVNSRQGAYSPHSGKSLQEASIESILQRASLVGLELIEAPRALPVLDENDYRKIDYYVQNFYLHRNNVTGDGSFLSRLLGGGRSGRRRENVMVTEVMGREFWQRYENKELAGEGENVLGVIPVVHIQNIAQPYYYEGISDVEQLRGLQDELNTRLSDRASRITFQAFKMYLAKGLEGLENKPVGPGRIWMTSNPEASVESFGGDGAAPSEDRHINEVREAMDKVSGVTPVAAGVLKNKLGNLTSGVALKMTFMGMLARTARKQLTYGEGLKEICRLVLHVLDVCGVYRTKESEREFEIQFPNPLPENMMERLEEAKVKKELGVSEEKVLNELGY
jgi:hypothetical protein